MKEKLKRLPLVLKLLFMAIIGLILYRDRDSLYRFCRYPFPFIMCPTCDYPCFFHTYRLQGIIALSASVTGLVSGRVFCGLVCPVGSIQDWLHSLKRRFFAIKMLPFKGLTATPGKSQGDFEKSLRFFKYPFLLLVLGYSLVRYVQALEIMPEMALVPAMIFTVQVRAIAGAGYINFWLIFLFVVFGIGLLSHRPWCKYLCPFGLVFAFLNKISFLKIKLEKKGCTGCKKCLENCTTGQPLNKLEQGFASVECVRCYDCVLTCPEGTVKLKAGGRG